MVANPVNITVYHGSYTEVRTPDLNKCKEGKDFGKGFYITTDIEQAKDFAKKVAIRYGKPNGVLNTYLLNNFDNISVYRFRSANQSWLDCVVGNRNSDYNSLSLKWKDYEVIIGKVADDDYQRVINRYMAEAYGAVGSQIARKLAVKDFKVEKLNNQICLRTGNAIEKLEFIRSEIVWQRQKQITAGQV